MNTMADLSDELIWSLDVRIYSRIDLGDSLFIPARSI